MSRLLGAVNRYLEAVRDESGQATALLELNAAARASAVERVATAELVEAARQAVDYVDRVRDPQHEVRGRLLRAIEAVVGTGCRAPYGPAGPSCDLEMGHDGRHVGGVGPDFRSWS